MVPLLAADLAIPVYTLFDLAILQKSLALSERAILQKSPALFDQVIHKKSPALSQQQE